MTKQKTGDPENFKPFVGFNTCGWQCPDLCKLQIHVRHIADAMFYEYEHKNIKSVEKLGEVIICLLKNAQKKK